MTRWRITRVPLREGPGIYGGAAYGPRAWAFVEGPASRLFHVPAHFKHPAVLYLARNTQNIAGRLAFRLDVLRMYRHTMLQRTDVYKAVEAEWGKEVAMALDSTATLILTPEPGDDLGDIWPRPKRCDPWPFPRPPKRDREPWLD